MGVLNRTSDAVLMIDKAPGSAGKLPIKPAHTEQKFPLSELHRTHLTPDRQNWALLEAGFHPLLWVGEERTGWCPHHSSATLDPLPQHFSLASPCTLSRFLFLPGTLPIGVFADLTLYWSFRKHVPTLSEHLADEMTQSISHTGPFLAALPGTDPHMESGCGLLSHHWF